ncbi:16S rRNA (guanine(527)-N(7))-methyltransferase RsmG [Elongatibacter sediminis]|uniref:Ribosomal RNA small subunit methyltransferase G n=1 Tax=Elongatibacter sediminis TaxID=3119006 RepID=A0AAW9RK77_9GAMM
MDRETPEEWLDEGGRALLGRDFEATERERLLAYLDLLGRWNRTYNLTAITDPLEQVSRHLLDSLTVLKFVDAGRLLDAGTGAGLPGVPLSIIRPDLEVTLLDSAGKKIRFLNQVRRQLGLANIRPVQARLESYRPDPPPDTVISRAFASLADFAAAARGLMTANTRLLAMKGRLDKTELAALPDWVRLDAVERLAVPGLQAERHLVIMSLRS